MFTFLQKTPFFIKKGVFFMKLSELIYNATNGDNICMEKLISKFSPLITKYSNKFSDSLDAKSELTLCFIKIIKAIPFNSSRFLEDKYLISYINTSIKRTYYALIKKDYMYINSNIFVASGEDFNNFTFKDNSNLIFTDLLKCLSSKESLIITMHYLYMYKDTDIAKKLNISRQNVCVTKKRALNKLKAYIS